MSEDISERRKYKRVSLELAVAVIVSDAGKVIKGTTVNLSASGMTVAIEGFIPLGRNLLISFKIQEGLVFENITAKILRTEDLEDHFNYGLEFLNLPREGAGKINALTDSISFIKRIKLFKYGKPY